MSHEYTLLLVDDEESILRSLRRVFWNEGYRIVTATSGPEALDLLKKDPVSLIISDQRMPDMIGAEFLSQAKSIRPHAIRIMLTGHSHVEAATQAINEGEIFRYLTKPWDDDQLRMTVREALGRYDLERQNRRLTFELQQKNAQLEDLNARLEDKVRERTHQLYLKLREVEAKDRLTQHMLTVNTLEDTLNMVVQVIVEILEHDTVVVRLQEGTALSPMAAAGPPGSGRGQLERLDPGPELARALDFARQGRRPLNVTDPGEPGTTPFAVVPLLRGDDLLGVIEVANHLSGGPVSDEDIQILESFSLQAAAVIHDAQAQQDLGDWKRQLDQVLANVAELDPLDLER